MKRLAEFAFWGGAALTQLTPLLTAVIVSAGAREVLYVAAHSPDVVAVNRELWSQGEPVAEIYGIPQGRIHVLWPDPARMVVPLENQKLTILLVNKRDGENPLQAATAWFFAKWVALAGGIAMLAAGAALAYWRP